MVRRFWMTTHQHWCSVMFWSPLEWCALAFIVRYCYSLNFLTIINNCWLMSPPQFGSTVLVRHDQLLSVLVTSWFMIPEIIHTIMQLLHADGRGAHSRTPLYHAGTQWANFNVHLTLVLLKSYSCICTHVPLCHVCMSLVQLAPQSGIQHSTIIYIAVYRSPHFD